MLLLKQVWPRAVISNRPEDGGSKHFRNVGKLPPDYTTQQLGRQSSAYIKKFKVNKNKILSALLTYVSSFFQLVFHLNIHSTPVFQDSV
jgi:hypothetical protein